ALRVLARSERPNKAALEPRPSRGNADADPLRPNSVRRAISSTFRSETATISSSVRFVATLYAGPRPPPQTSFSQATSRAAAPSASEPARGGGPFPAGARFPSCPDHGRMLQSRTLRRTRTRFASSMKALLDPCSHGFLGKKLERTKRARRAVGSGR